AAVQHPDELLQIAEGDLLRRKTTFKSIFDLLQANVAVEHAEDKVFLIMKAVILQAHRLLDDPVAGTLIVVPAGGEVRPFANRKWPRRAADQRFGECCHITVDKI